MPGKKPTEDEIFLLIDIQIEKSVKKTKRLIALDIGHETGSFSSEIIARAAMCLGETQKSPPQRIGLPDLATQTSVGATKDYYPDADTICEAVGASLGIEINTTELLESISPHHDIPGNWFKGPF